MHVAQAAPVRGAFLICMPYCYRMCSLTLFVAHSLYVCRICCCRRTDWSACRSHENVACMPDMLMWSSAAHDAAAWSSGAHDAAACLIYQVDARVSRLPYMYALYVCLICMPYMYAVYVCRICYRVCVYAVYVDI